MAETVREGVQSEKTRGFFLPQKRGNFEADKGSLESLDENQENVESQRSSGQ